MLPTSEKKITFTALKNIVLIGGGDLMVASAHIFKNTGFNLSVISANRHIDEKLVLKNDTLKAACSRLNLTSHTLNDINLLSTEELSTIIPENSMAICFGPAWIFNDKVIEIFHYGMFNINAIPIPHYLGGAHYTWQLLNKNNEGGCFFQQITDKVDQGDIFAKHEFGISPTATTPNDYFIENVEQGVCFIKKLAISLIEETPFTPSPYKELNEHRLYLPRLRTDKQAYINWLWTAQNIVSFCQGFDAPYMGAASFIQNKELRFKKMKLITLTDNQNNDIPAMHPFCAGLVIRKIKKTAYTQIIVAAIGGFIELHNVYDEHGKCMKHIIKEGMRIHTPQKTLDEAISYHVSIDGQGFKD